MAVKVVVEFVGSVRELFGRDYIVPGLSEEGSLAEVLKVLGKLLGEERYRRFEEMLKRNEVLIIVNGLEVADLSIRLNHMDKVYISPIAFGG